MHDSCEYLRPLWQSQQEYGLIFWSCVVWGQSLLSYIYTCRVICLCYVHTCVWCPMLSVSLGCPFLIAPSPFSNVYFENYIGVIFKSLDYDKDYSTHASYPLNWIYTPNNSRRQRCLYIALINTNWRLYIVSHSGLSTLTGGSISFHTQVYQQ